MPWGVIADYRSYHHEGNPHIIPRLNLRLNASWATLDAGLPPETP